MKDWFVFDGDRGNAAIELSVADGAGRFAPDHR